MKHRSWIAWLCRIEVAASAQSFRHSGRARYVSKRSLIGGLDPTVLTACCVALEITLKALLVRVGADESDGGGNWNGPVDCLTGQFTVAVAAVELRLVPPRRR